MNDFRKNFITAIIFFSVVFIFFHGSTAFAATRTWDGGGTTNNWSEPTNWSGDAVPTSADDVVFNATSLIKDSTWDALGPAQIQSLNVSSTYAGVLSLDRNVSVSANWTFNGSNFNANTYTLSFVGYGASTFTPGSVTYYTVEQAKQSSDYGLIISGTGTTNHLIISGAAYLNGGTLNVTGNVTVTSNSVGYYAGTGTINLNGNTNQTVSSTVTNQQHLSNVRIDKAEGTLSLVGTIRVAGNWTWVNGSLDAGTSVLQFVKYDNSTFTPGSVTYNDIEINKYSSGYKITLSGTGATLDGYFKILRGTFIQDGHDLRVNDDIEVYDTWSISTSTITNVYIGSTVYNEGYIQFDSGSYGYYGCDTNDRVFIRSTVNGVRRSWFGPGIFRMVNVDVKDQGGSVPIRVSNGANSGNNASNWQFDFDNIWNPASSTLISSVFDTKIIKGATLNNIGWNGYFPSGALAYFQIASSNNSAGPWNFYGPDGTGVSYYVPPGPGRTIVINLAHHSDKSHSNKRYFRYKVILWSDGCRTISPRISDIFINWSP